MKSYTTARDGIRVATDGRVAIKITNPDLLVNTASKFMDEHCIPYTKEKLARGGADTYYGSTSNSGVPVEIAWLMLKNEEMTEEEACEQWLADSLANPWSRLDDPELKVELKSTVSWDNYDQFFPNLFASKSKLDQMLKADHILWSYTQGFVTQRRYTTPLGVNAHGHKVYATDIMVDPAREIGKSCWIVFNDWLSPDSMLPLPFKWEEYVIKTGTSQSVKFAHDGKEGKWNFCEKAADCPVLRELAKIEVPS